MRLLYLVCCGQWYTCVKKLKLKIMLPHINLSTDTAILAIIAFVVVLGLALKKDRLRHLALTVYMGLALAYELGTPLTGYINGHGQSFTLGTIKLALFVAPILLLAFGGGKHGKHKAGQRLIMTLITSVLLACLIVATALDLMDRSAASSLLGQSQIATILYSLRLVWLGTVPVSILLSLFIKPKSPH